MKKIILFLICSTIFFSNGSKAQQYSKEETKLREAIAQMLIIGFKEAELNATTPIYSLITKEKIGGVILFDYDIPSKTFQRNIRSSAQLRKLCTDIQSAGKGSLFISIDQEGGKVNRLKEKYGFPPSVSQQFLGENNSDELTSQWAARTANTLKDLGINLNFVPSVDVNINPQCPIIGKVERSFSQDPKIVINHAKIVIKEHRKQGILTSLKHFPGHGSSLDDTHQGIADVTKTYNADVEILPFKELIESGYADMIMTSHVFNSNFDDKYPSTMSYNTLTNILKVQLGFKGIIVSDDMTMGAMAKNYDLPTSLEKGINAGVDMFIFGNNSEKYDPLIGQRVIDCIYNLVKNGKVSKERIYESASKIYQIKQMMRLTNHN